MPALCSYLLGGDIKEKDSWLVRLAKKGYTPGFHISRMRSRKVVISGASRAFCFGS
jgi:Cu/Ag efflux pump CusA